MTQETVIPNVPLYLGEPLVSELLDPRTVLSIVERTLISIARGEAFDGPKMGFPVAANGGSDYVGGVAGHLRKEHAVGIKWFATIAGNAAIGLPRVPATILLCDARTGLLEGVVDAGEMTARRTAALAIAAARPWIAGGVNKACVVGFGAIGRRIAAYIEEEFGAHEIAVAGRDIGKLREACAEMERGRSASSLYAAADIRSAVSGAQLVFTSAGLTGNAPIVRSEWLAPDAVVCAMGSYQEVESHFIERADAIVIDNWEAGQHRGNLAPLIAAGRISRQDVRGVAETVAGKDIVSGPQTRSVFISLTGMGSLDVALADHALKLARSRDLGLPLVRSSMGTAS